MPSNSARSRRPCREHVLGTLDGHERREAERLADSDAEFQKLLARWRSRFAELDETAAQPAGEALWRRIEGSLDEDHATEAADCAGNARRGRAAGGAEPGTAFTALWRNLAFWRFAGLATAAATLILGVGLALALLRPTDRPIHVAVLLTDDNRPAAVVHAFADGSAHLIPLQDIDVPRDRALQVWTLSGSRPRARLRRPDGSRPHDPAAPGGPAADGGEPALRDLGRAPDGLAHRPADRPGSHEGSDGADLVAPGGHGRPTAGLRRREMGD